MKVNWRYLAISAGALVLAVAIITAVLQINNRDTGPKVVGVFINDSQTEQEKHFAEQISEQLERNGFAVKLYNAKSDQSKQNQQFFEFLQKKCEAALLCPVMPDATAELVQKAREEGVPLVFFEREPAKEILDLWERVAYVGCNSAEVGKLQGQLIANQDQKGDINGDGMVSYVVLRDSEESTDTDRRVQSAVDTLKEKIFVSKLNDVCPGNTQTAAKETFSRLLANYGKDVEVVFCTNDTLALGAYEAISNGGRTVGKDIFLVGADGLNKVLDSIQKGKITGTVLCDLDIQSQKIVDIMQELMTQPATEKQNYVNHVVVTKENAAQYAQ